MTENLSSSGKLRFFEKHVRKWSTTEQSQSGYCRANKISFANFRYWKRKIEENPPPALVEVPLPKSMTLAPCSTHPDLCLVIGPYRIEIRKGFDSEDLERVIQILERI